MYLNVYDSIKYNSNEWFCYIVNSLNEIYLNENDFSKL